MQMMNMVAALEMVMNNGTHPLTQLKIGPDTHEFKSFDDFLCFVLPNSSARSLTTRLNITPCSGKRTSIYGRLLFCLRLLTAASKKDATRQKGGATYNSSGTAIIGLADVTDSFMIIKKLVFEEKKLTFAELKKSCGQQF